MQFAYALVALVFIVVLALMETKPLQVGGAGVRYITRNMGVSTTPLMAKKCKTHQDCPGADHTVKKCCKGLCVWRQQCETNKDCGTDKPVCNRTSAYSKCMTKGEARRQAIRLRKKSNTGVWSKACFNRKKGRAGCVCWKDEHCDGSRGFTCGADNFCEKPGNPLSTGVHEPEAYNQIQTECPAEWNDMQAELAADAKAEQLAKQAAAANAALLQEAASGQLFNITVWEVPRGTSVDNFNAIADAVIRNDFRQVDDTLGFRPHVVPVTPSTPLTQLADRFRGSTMYIVRGSTVDQLNTSGTMSGNGVSSDATFIARR